MTIGSGLRGGCGAAQCPRSVPIAAAGGGGRGGGGTFPQARGYFKTNRHPGYLEKNGHRLMGGGLHWVAKAISQQRGGGDSFQKVVHNILVFEK